MAPRRIRVPRVDTAEDLRDAARRARECTVTSQAVSLARWIGSGRPPAAGLGALLDGFGAVIDDPGGPVITPLGRWATEHLAGGLAGRADPGWPAEKVIAEAARFGDEKQRAFVAGPGSSSGSRSGQHGRSSPPPRACHRYAAGPQPAVPGLCGVPGRLPRRVLERRGAGGTSPVRPERGQPPAGRTGQRLSHGPRVRDRY